MVTGNILYKAINKHSFNWQFVPRNLKEKKVILFGNVFAMHTRIILLKPGLHNRQQWSIETPNNP